MNERNQNEPENQYPFIERRQAMPCQHHDKRLSIAEQSINSMERTMEGVSTKLDLILAQITKIALLEQRHATAEVDISRAHDKVDKLEEKHDQLSIEIREFVNRTKGMTQIIWGIGGVVGALLVKVLFFAAHSGMAP